MKLVQAHNQAYRENNIIGSSHTSRMTFPQYYINCIMLHDFFLFYIKMLKHEFYLFNKDFLAPMELFFVTVSQLDFFGFWFPCKNEKHYMRLVLVF
jgi:hypothetical protein